MIVMCDVEDLEETIDEGKQIFMIQLLVALGLTEEHFENPNSDETQEYMKRAIIEVYDHLGTYETDILKDREIIAQWKEPKIRRIREKDGKEYYRVHFNFWSSIPIEFGTE